MNDQHEDIRPSEGTERKYRVREDGKLESDPDEEVDFEENLCFNDDE